ncbi:hypothetical protein GCM10009416_41480 [Craurococcus roseus]|uniref:Transporter n=1 Tax=Craurococcus roseus TaxID=77585 RepID=A0ABN1FW23_9PROT
MPRLLQPAFAAFLLTPPLLLSAAPRAAAQEEPITLADDPFEITDPIAAPPGEAELAVVGSYARSRRGRVRNTAGIDTELEVGVARRLSLRFGQIGDYGNLDVRRRLGFATDRTGAADDGSQGPNWGGATVLGALYQLAEEHGAVPAAAFQGRARMIYGPGRPAYEADLAALFGKTFARDGGLQLGVNLNLGWVARIDPLPSERPNRVFVNASIGQAVRHDTALVATYAREQQERGQRDFSLVQVGIRHRLPNGRTVLGLAGGVGTNRDSPRFELAFALQWAFGVGGR